jgi:hypothetical protein
MAWTYNSIRIYAHDYEEGNNQILPRLQPLSGGTILQSYGYESDVRNISAIVVGDTNKDALRVLTKSGGTAYALVSPEGSMGNWILKSFKAKRTPSVCQSIDQTQDETAPVYDIELELHRED